MQLHNWYIITGGPGAGKTTIIKELEKRGHTVVPESARDFITMQIKAGVSLATVRSDEKTFQEAVFHEKQNIHKAQSKDVLTFFDRGYHDTVGYLKFHGHEVEAFIATLCENMVYKKVFALDMLPYRRDEIRIESHTTALGLHKTLIDTYTDFGHHVIKVPVMPISQRADFILANL